MAENIFIQHNPKIFDPNTVFLPTSTRAQAVSACVFIILAAGVISGISLLLTHTSLFGSPFIIPFALVTVPFGLTFLYAVVRHLGAKKLENDAKKFLTEIHKHDIQHVANFFKGHHYSFVTLPPTTFFAHAFNAQINNLLARSDLTANDVKTLEDFAFLCDQTSEVFLRERWKLMTSGARDIFIKNSEPKASELIIKILETEELYELFYIYSNTCKATQKGIFEIIAGRAQNNADAFYLFCALIKKNADAAQLLLEIVQEKHGAQALFRPLISRLFQHALKSTTDCQEHAFLVSLYPLLNTSKSRCSALRLEYAEIETHPAYMNLWSKVVKDVRFDTEHTNELVEVVSPIISALKKSQTANSIQARRHFLQISRPIQHEKLDETIAPLVEDQKQSIQRLSLYELIEKMEAGDDILPIWIHDKEETFPTTFRDFVKKENNTRKWTLVYDQLSFKHKFNWCFSDERVSIDLILRSKEWNASYDFSEQFLIEVKRHAFSENSPWVQEKLKKLSKDFKKITLPYDFYKLWIDMNQCRDHELKIRCMYNLSLIDANLGKKLITAQELLDEVSYLEEVKGIGVFPVID